MRQYYSLLFILTVFFCSSVPAVELRCKKPKYPVVFLHGIMASDSLFSWRNVQSRLLLRGVRTFLTEVSSVNPVEYRAEQLVPQLNRILKRTKSNRLNLIAHSMGGLDARFLISKLNMSKKISSLTTISTPHRGSAAAKYILKDLDSNYKRLDRLIHFLTSLYNSHTKLKDADLKGSIGNLTEEFTAQFNREVKDDPNVYYQSWSSTASPKGNPAKLRRVLRESWDIIQREEGPNDGLVAVSSSKWGHYRGNLPADHLTVAGIQPELRPQLKVGKFYYRVLCDLARRGH